MAPAVDVSIVTYSPDLSALGALVGSLSEQTNGVKAHLLIQDNSPDLETATRIERMLAAETSFTSVDVQRSGENLGFGRGHNANAARGSALSEAHELTESALRGLACRCPRCGKGKLFAGFINLRPRCESCGLDYAFIDAGDGPAIFIIMIAGAIVVGSALIVEVKYQPPRS